MSNSSHTPAYPSTELALWVWGLLQTRHRALGRVADELPMKGTKASRIRRFKR